MAKEIKTGDTAPDFCLPDKDKNKICIKDYHGKWLVLYFYPKDNTPGCTLEAKGFTDALDDFHKMNAEVLAVSPDDSDSHCKFYDKHNLSLTLLSDTSHDILEKYGVWKKKKMFGKEFFGVVRSTFIIDPNGKIAHSWRKVKVPGHVQAVKDKLMVLQG